MTKDMKKLLLVAAAAVMAACSAPVASEDYASYVNPKIGTGGHGHVFVGANVPFGFVQLGPTSIPQSWDWCSGYHDSDNTVIGFSHTHLSGTGIGDLFDVTVMPVTGLTTPERGSEDQPGRGAWSYADRSQEITEPGYYSVPLVRYGIKAEMTATSRVGFHRYTFPAHEQSALIFDLENGGCWDDVKDAGFEVVKNEEGQVTALGGFFEPYCCFRVVFGYDFSSGVGKSYLVLCRRVSFFGGFSVAGESFFPVTGEYVLKA